MVKMLEIRLSKCLLMLSERELLALLASDRNLWKMAMQRGKAAKRLQRFEQPAGIKPVTEGGDTDAT
ncbi:MAG: hypothetical protein M1571_02510 [Firmicutes bacterium]|jgi:hypothetical protein|nr:hypothetical protein [Bacillota bacterium]